MDLKRKEKGNKMKITDATKEIGDEEITIVVLPPENLIKYNIAIFKYLSKKYKKGIYITINQPYASLIKKLKKEKLKLDNIFFIDLVTATLTSNPTQTKNCLFVDSATSLTELGISIEQIISNIEGKKFLIIDNLGAFLIYNNEDVFLEFCHFLINKLRLNSITTVFMTVNEEESMKLVKNIGGFCDKVINVS